MFLISRMSLYECETKRELREREREREKEDIKNILQIISWEVRVFYVK